MKTLEEKFEAIAAQLKKQMAFVDEDIQAANDALMLLESDEETYNSEWLKLSGLLAMSHFLHTLDELTKRGELKDAENFIRFNCHQIERFTDKELLVSENIKSTGNEALDCKIALHDIFTFFLLDIIERN